jgi:hypothetical protein
MEATEDPSRPKRPSDPLAEGCLWQYSRSAAAHSSPDYIRDFQIVWQESGFDCVRQLAKKNPEAFVALAGKLVPNDVKVSTEQAYSGLDQTILRGIKESPPAANSE